MDIAGVGLDFGGRQGFVHKSREGFGHWRGGRINQGKGRVGHKKWEGLEH